jgi:hypothetical protein
MKQPRRWFQLHLSTVVVLTLVAGTIVGLNMVKVPLAMKPIDALFWYSCADSSWTHPCVEISDLRDGLSEFSGSCYGWPFIALVNNRDRSEYLLDRNGMIADFILGALTLVFVGCPCEYFIRRRTKA